MTKPLSRAKRVNYDAPEAARAAARRSGKSLDEWLEDAIFEKAEADLHDGEDLDDDDRLEALTRRLKEAEEKLRRFDPQATQETIEALEKRVIESERKITKVLSAFADLIKNEQEGVSKTPDNLGSGILENLERLKRRVA
jgi:lysyl-tRNA synthetase class I